MSLRADYSEEPIDFSPIHLCTDINAPLKYECRVSVSKAAGRRFYQTKVESPVCVPDEGDPTAYSAQDGYGQYPRGRQPGYLLWHTTVHQQVYGGANVPAILHTLTQNQFNIVHSEWSDAKSKELQSTEANLIPYFPSREVRDAHLLRSRAARRAAFPHLTLGTTGQTQQSASESIQGTTSTDVQQPVEQEVFFDGLGHYDSTAIGPEFYVHGHGLQRGWMLQILRDNNIRYDSDEGHEFVREFIGHMTILPPIYGFPEGILLTQDEWSLGLMYWQNMATTGRNYTRNVNGDLVPVPTTMEIWQKHDTFYQKVLRRQLRSRKIERAAEGL